MDRHTPNQWNAETDLPFGHHPRVHDATGKLIAVVGNADRNAEDEWEAHAHLIAAAPDLKQELRSSLCPRPCNNRPNDFEAGSCFDAGECGCGVGNALAKAEGRQSTSMEGGEG